MLINPSQILAGELGDTGTLSIDTGISRDDDILFHAGKEVISIAAFPDKRRVDAATDGDLREVLLGIVYLAVPAYCQVQVRVKGLLLRVVTVGGVTAYAQGLARRHDVTGLHVHLGEVAVADRELMAVTLVFHHDMLATLTVAVMLCLDDLAACLRSKHGDILRTQVKAVMVMGGTGDAGVPVADVTGHDKAAVGGTEGHGEAPALLAPRLHYLPIHALCGGEAQDIKPLEIIGLDKVVQLLGITVRRIGIASLLDPSRPSLVVGAWSLTVAVLHQEP